MSLLWRLLLVVLVLNLLVLAVVQTASLWVQRQWFQRQIQAYTDIQFSAILEEVYSPERLRGTARQMRRLLAAKSIRELFRDALVTTTEPPYEGFVHLNPRGAVHRDPDRFPRAEILAGLEQARAQTGPVPAGGGFCLAIRADDRVVGSIWFVPRDPPPPVLPLWVPALTVLASTLLFGLLVYWTIRRTVQRPLRRVGEAAAMVGAGRYDVRVPRLTGARELDVLVQAFNAMAAKVEGHTDELERTVREAVEEAKRKERALIVSSRLAAMGTLAAGIAHEINNPIGGMLNAVHRLLQREDLDDMERTYLGMVLEGLQRIGRTARRVLDFSPRKVQAETFELQTALEAARALVDYRLRQQEVTLRVDLAAGLPRLHGDVHEIQQVLLNLLLNSLDALAGRGRGGRIEVRARAEGDRVEVVVEDDGPGMDPALLGRVLDPFYSGKDRPDASGLGMFISYSIIESHGGEMELSSEPGKGFRVRLLLPAAGPESAAAGG